MKPLNIVIDGIPAREIVERMKARGLVRFAEPIFVAEFFPADETRDGHTQNQATVTTSPEQ